jgi:tRNA wybutosine-synthesizing protein 2
MPRPVGPVDRVRLRARERWGDAAAARVPRRYTRLGRVAVVPLPEELRPHFATLGEWYSDELAVETVVRSRGPITGEDRRPALETVYGNGTETEVVEHGIRFRFDAARIMFARGNKTERARLAAEVAPGERVADLFAGIGYFTLPIARAEPTVRIVAVERNPVAFRYLAANLVRNGVDAQVLARCGDNREIPLPGEMDRVLLGYLPSSLPWLDRALGLLRPDGGLIHAHWVVDAAVGAAGAETEIRDALARRGAQVVDVRPRIVKSYGPGRSHAVADCRVVPAFNRP